MGREIKRVPLDFNHPLKVVWPGFIYPSGAGEDWERQEPPSGEGWQVWETVSEGSPISPVFSSEKELKQYLLGQGYSENAVDYFIEEKWCPSMAFSGGVLYNNIEACSQFNKKQPEL
jgi:hypothetical protein